MGHRRQLHRHRPGGGGPLRRKVGNIQDVIYLHEALDKKPINGPCTEQDIYDATFEGAVLRLRPKLMTVAVALIGLVPIMWSTGTSADVMRPIAAPMIGGMISSAVHVLITTPVIFVLMKKREIALFGDEALMSTARITQKGEKA